jgi:serine/threonine protein kinase
MPPEPSAREARRNQRIGRYEVLQYLATGGMGAVYRALNTESGQEVALKVLPPEIAIKPGMLERFRQEAIHAAKLRHGHIVTLFEYAEVNHTHFLAMEFVDGIDLHEYVSRKGPLEPDEARVIVTQAALALDHAHEQGIVHRDIKPSNFLITRHEGRLWVKLTDFGLAREANDEEFRVTRAGSTVGTVDYMAPEQARDSRAADRRSDIYSLGCTLYFMLSGRPPFPEGGLTERILQHAESEPPDICSLNRKVPQTLAAVLQRMLAKKPANRYQTAAALFEDLERLRSGTAPRHLEVFTMMDDMEDVIARRQRLETMQRALERNAMGRVADGYDQYWELPEGLPRPKARDASDTDEDVAARTQSLLPVLRFGWLPRPSRSVLLTGAGIFLLLVIGGGLTWWLLPSFQSRNAQANQQGPVETARDNPGVEASSPEITPPKPEVTPPKPPVSPPVVTAEPPPNRSGAPVLYQPAAPLPAEALRSEFVKPAAPPATPSGRTRRVSRSAVPGDGIQFTSLAEACAAAEENQETVIEIHDNGPLFEPVVEARNKSLIIRAAKGYRPLIAWERGRAGATGAGVFLSLDGGRLTLENLDFVQQLPEASSDDTVLCRISGGDFIARRCTFSVAGRSRGVPTLIQMDGRASDSSPTRCRLTACYLRGGDTVALDLRTPGVDVLLEDTLVVGGSRPLLDIAGSASDRTATQIRVLRSTFVGGQTALRIRPASSSDTQPQVHWSGWDALLARAHTEAGGEMVSLVEGAGSQGLQWRATNCLYAGWRTLLGGRDPIGAESIAAWHARWGRSEGDRALLETWPARPFTAPWDEPAEAYRTARTPVWFAGSAGGEALGCDLAALPRIRDSWYAITYGRLVAPPFAMSSEAGAPAIPVLSDGRYHGERLNLNEVDLGEYLEKMRQKMPFGPKVVLHLTGNGERHTSPIRVRGSGLVLCFEQAPEDADPLVLTYAKGAPNPPALIDVEDGSLELLGISVKLSNSTLQPHPQHLIRVRGGDLQVYGCRLIGPLGRAPNSFAGLIGFGGSAEGPTSGRDCAIVDTVLAAGNTCIHGGSGGRIRLRNCLVVAGRDAFHLDPGPPPGPRIKSQCYVDSSTIAARRAVVRLGDSPGLLPLEPFVVQARWSVFLDPFAGGIHQAAIVAYEGDSLARGLLAWRGDENGYDKRLPYYIAPVIRPEQRMAQQSYDVWSRLWGTSGDRDALVLDLQGRSFDLDKLPLESLKLSASTRKGGETLGADFAQLPIGRNRDRPKSSSLGP